MSFLSPSRCVLMLTDEGLHVYRVSSLSSKYIEFVPWDDESFSNNVSKLIVQECGKKSVVILNDMVEQHYRKEKIPKTSAMDRAAVIKRRLSMAFPSYPIRAALKLKNQEKGSSGISTYLFASIPQSDAYKKTIESVRRSGAPIVGLYLLPVEGATMVKALSQKKSKKRSEWTIFIGQHHGGGLRQIVTKGGDLALTRMTPVVDTDVEGDVWVKEVSAELQSTMSYLARFGYKPEDGLDIFIVANENTQIILEEAIDIPSNLYCMSASEIGSLVGITLGKQDDLRYADPLYAAWLGRQRKFVLSMQNQALIDIAKPRKIVNLIMAVASIAAIFLGYDVFHYWNTYALKSDNLNVLKQENYSLNQEYKTLLAEKSVDGYDYLLVNNTIEIHDTLLLKKTDPFIILRALGQHLGPNLTIDKIEINTVKAPENSFDEGPNYNYEYDESGEIVPAEQGLLLKAVVKLSFGRSVATETAVNKVIELVENLKLGLSGFDVVIDKQVGGVSYSETFAEEIGGTQVEQALNKSAIIVITQQPVKKDVEEF